MTGRFSHSNEKSLHCFRSRQLRNLLSRDLHMGPKYPIGLGLKNCTFSNFLCLVLPMPLLALRVLVRWDYRFRYRVIAW
ncbi:hypothetical protein J6590_063487 [Homalodisca vitripennis]|nr:hypothetical protein J6590_063487 [Homalodisca vitripennis]